MDGIHSFTKMAVRGHLLVRANRAFGSTGGQASLPWTLQTLPTVVCAGETTDNAKQSIHHAGGTVKTRTDGQTEQVIHFEGEGKKQSRRNLERQSKGREDLLVLLPVAFCPPKLSLPVIMLSPLLSSLRSSKTVHSSTVHGFSSCYCSNIRINQPTESWEGKPSIILHKISILFLYHIGASKMGGGGRGG